ncbi:Fic family protein [Streptomyces citrinus]|uniref:Fic family protein n=1 Tax=Streptomyces citrinus TaxID=3118173 RepID=UPI003CC5A8D1
MTGATARQFSSCLAEATRSETDEPLPARAARVYLDICFFHPFDDGNGRAALLALGHVLAREDVILDEVGPLHIPRYAPDPYGPQSLSRLVHALVRAAASRGGGPVSPVPSSARR